MPSESDAPVRNVGGELNDSTVSAADVPLMRRRAGLPFYESDR